MKYLSVLLFAFIVSLTACEDGSAERLGENVDDAATDAGNAVEDLCEDIKDAAGADNKNC